MEIFLVVTRSADWQDQYVFSSPKAAFSYAKNHEHQQRPKILEMPVIGDLEDPATVYTVSWHDRTNDTMNVESVFGSYMEAKRAVGSQGRVLRREIRSM
jgi:hypothetical protein